MKAISDKQIANKQHEDRAAIAKRNAIRRKWNEPRKRILLALGYYDRRIHEGAARYCREAGWVLDSSPVHTGHLPLAWQGDGLIALGSPGRPDINDFVKQSRLPCVDLGAPFKRNRWHPPPIAQDNAKIAQIICNHFVERGFEHIAFIKLDGNWVETERLQGLKLAVEATGRRFSCFEPAKEIPKKRKKDSWVELLAEILSKQQMPIALSGQDDHVATGILRACELAHIGVPEQVSICGVDNDVLVCEYSTVPLTSVESGLDDLGYEAARLLDGLMQGGQLPTDTVRVPPHSIVTRKSTDIMAIRNTDVAIALSFIRDHYTQQIGVDDVAAHTSLSRRRLHDAFVKHFGASISDEITKLRIEKAIEMLRTTQDKVHTISIACGFASPQYMSTVFRRVLQQSPKHYRND